MRKTRFQYCFGLMLFLGLLSPTDGFSRENTPVQQDAGEVILEKHIGSSPGHFDSVVLDCMRQELPLFDAAPFKQEEGGSLADYLSRFYAHTHAFHEAKHRDSFILAYRPETQDAQRDTKYHIAIFTY